MGYSSEAVLTRILTSLENKRKTIRLINSSIAFLLLTSVSLGLASVLARFYSSDVYFSILKTLAILSVCFGFMKLLLPALFKKETTAEVAKELEKTSPGLGEDTINAVLLMGEVQSEKKFGISKPLVGAHIENVAAKLESLDLSPSLPEEKTKSYWKHYAAVFVLSLFALISSPSEFRGFLFSTSILPPSEPYLLELADIKLNYHYPDYTGIPPREVNGSSGDIDALKGTNVTFAATPLKPLEKGNLIFEKGHIISLTTEQGKIRAEFRIISSGTFYIEDTSGKYSSRVFKITSLEDKNPRVSIENSSPETVEIEGQDRLDINYRAEDDFGLGKLLLTWNTKKGESSRLITETEEGSKLREGKFVWELGSVDSDPGETIEIRVKAYDNDTVSGPKFGVSNPIKVKLQSHRKKHEDTLALADKLMNEMLDMLGDQIENSSTLSMGQHSDGGRMHSESANQFDSQLTNMTKAKHVQEGITIKIEQLLSPLEKLLEGMRTDEFSEYAYFHELSSMKTRIQGLLEKRHGLIASLSAADLPRLNSIISEEINEFEDDILFLDSMLKGEKLRESMLYGKDTLREYNELSELLDKLKNGGDQTTIHEIAKKIGELKSLVAELTEKLGSLSKDFHEGFLNADAFDSLDLQGKLDQIMKLAQAGKIEEASELLTALKEGVQNLIASLESDFQSFGLASFSKEMNKLNEIISRVGNIEEKQTNLKDRTINLKESLLKSPRNKQSMSDFLEIERKKIERLKNMLFETKAKVSPNIPEHKIIEASLLIDRAMSKTDELEHWLQALDFEEALEHSKELENDTTAIKGLNKLTWEIAEGYRDAEKPVELAREIRRDLENALREETGNGQSFQIAKTQDELEKETSGVGNDITEFQNDSFLPPTIGQKLGESRGFMRGATGNMKTNEISKAISNQEEAIKKLKSAREQAEALLKNYRLSSKGSGMSVPLVLGNQFQEGSQGVDTGHVEIPAPEESQIGKEFKESILKALKDGSPEGYSELNKRYYDRIIK